MSSSAFMAVASTFPASCGPPRRSKAKDKSHKKKLQPPPTLGFGGKEKEPLWKCVQGCGACCKLNKGPAFATPEEIFEDPTHAEHYRSLIGSDGWCIHYEKTTRTCSIYSDRPYFCRVEPGIFHDLYGIEEKRFNKDACSFCRDTIKAIYGPHSQELELFKEATRDSNIM